MAHLALSFLGTFQVTRGDKSVTAFVSDKARALLAYLAVEADRPHRREALAGLLWPDRPQGIALNSVRQALFNLRRATGDVDATLPLLLITRQTVQFNRSGDCWLDEAAFTEWVRASRVHFHPQAELCELCVQRLGQAAELYRGAFLEGFTVGDSLAFEEWALLKREWLNNQALDVFQRLADYYEERADYERASYFARRGIGLDPCREEAHRQLMRVLALGGQRSVALSQYQRCRQILAEELGVDPSRETTALYERLRML